MLASAIIFAFLLLLRFPIYVAIMTSGLYLQVVVNHVPPEVVIYGIWETLSKTAILAVPFFLLSGSLMSSSSMGTRLVEGVLPWVRRLRGGVGIGVVIANEIFGAMSGSSTAATGTIGRLAYPPLLAIHGERFALGLVAATGPIAIIMPPSIAMILFAAATNTSSAKLFLSGVLPAIFLLIILGSYLILVTPRRKQGDTFNLSEALHKTKAAVPVLFLPVIILGGIYGGIFTPTEAGAIAVVYCFSVPYFVFHELRGTALSECLFDFIRINSQIFIIVAASSVFSQAIIMSNVATDLAKALSGTNPYIFLMLFNIFLLVVGCFFDPSPAILIIAPIMVPIAHQLHIDLVHLGLIMTVNLAIGMFTPPYGLNLFVLQSIFKMSLERVSSGVLPFFFLYLLALVIVTYFPELYMWLPNQVFK